jgi:hypothetical protein
MSEIRIQEKRRLVEEYTEADKTATELAVRLYQDDSIMGHVAFHAAMAAAFEAARALVHVKLSLCETLAHYGKRAEAREIGRELEADMNEAGYNIVTGVGAEIWARINAL